MPGSRTRPLLLVTVMADPNKRRAEILHEITRLGKLQKEAVEVVDLKNESPIRSGAYEERAKRISRLVAELVSLGEVGTS
jgi:hypothetical protein